MRDLIFNTERSKRGDGIIQKTKVKITSWGVNPNYFIILSLNYNVNQQAYLTIDYAIMKSNEMPENIKHQSINRRPAVDNFYVRTCLLENFQISIINYQSANLHSTSPPEIFRKFSPMCL